MAVKLLGYSERGMVNALCDDLSQTPSLLKEFLSWFDFSGTEQLQDLESIQSATLLVEQSFSDFGDLDLLILLEHTASAPQAILIEAKVSNDTNSWLDIKVRWIEFLTILDGGEGSTSNLFVQLHRKVQLVNFLRNNEKGFVSDILTTRGNLGENQVVRRAKAKLKECVQNGNAFFGAILPDDMVALNSFVVDEFQNSHFPDLLPTWDAKGWGFLSWQTVFKNVERESKSWPRTSTSFQWNSGQIFRTQQPLQHLIEAGQIYSLNGQPVFVAKSGIYECRVIELNTDDEGFFWKTRAANVHELQPLEIPGLKVVLPNRPLPGATYIWDCRADAIRLPQQMPSVEIECGVRVTVMRKTSWHTIRVRLENSSPETPDFLVFTHHLKRTL